MLIFSKDSLRTQIEAATGGKVTVLYDDKGYPSYMVRIPKFNIEDVISGAGAGVHPAFIVDGVEKPEIFIGQYQATVQDGRACSIPGMDPTASLDFDTAQGYCNAKGVGWHMMTNAEWAAIALWCHKNGTLPNGNNNYGRDVTLTHQTGTRQDGLAPGLASGTARTLSGSGPASWRHDNTLAGICDLNGNVWEWVGGMRLDGGEIQIIGNNDAAATGADHSETSELWQAIAAAGGALVAPGTPGSLKYDATGANNTGEAQLDDILDNAGDGATSTTTTFDTMAVDAGIIIPDIATQLLLAPGSNSAFGDDKIHINNFAERLPTRGGFWNNGLVAGLASLSLTSARTNAAAYFGFRPAFVA